MKLNSPGAVARLRQYRAVSSSIAGVRSANCRRVRIYFIVGKGNARIRLEQQRVFWTTIFYAAAAWSFRTADLIANEPPRFELVDSEARDMGRPGSVVDCSGTGRPPKM
jgi:hypothetical protein